MTVADPPSDAPAQRSTRAPRLLIPREHGAYGQLALPLLAALLSRPVRLSAVLLLLASAAFFVAHEPLLVLLGLRGGRARRDDGPRARRWLGLLALFGALCGAIGARLTPSGARLALALPLALALVVGGFIAARRERTLLGETIAACALASAGVPVVAAGGASLAPALWAWLAWCVGYGAVTPAVRGVIAHHKRAISLGARLIPLGVPWCLWGVMLASAAPASSVVAALPLLVVSSALAAAPPNPRHLKRVGWALVAASTATCVALVTG